MHSEIDLDLFSLQDPPTMQTTPPTTLQPEFGRRLAVAREALKLTQAALSKALGFKDRQTLQAIEAGKRGVSAEELLAILDATGRDLDFFTDRFRLVGEGRFSFRAHRAGDTGFDTLEEQAGEWVALWRDLGRRQGLEVSPLRQQLALHDRSSYEDAQAAGEALWEEWKLGDRPALRLADAAEERIGLLVLEADLPLGISGAACQVPGADTIVINREDSEGRRNFDLAHEIFHVLTWDAMPPRRVDRENPRGYKDKRIEQLADNFAGALLMPRALIVPLWESRQNSGLSLMEWFQSGTDRFRVSVAALRTRLQVLGLFDDADRFDLQEERIKSPSSPKRPPFSRRYLERAATALERGDLSVRRLVGLLNADSPDQLGDWFTEHGLSKPFDL